MWLLCNTGVLNPPSAKAHPLLPAAMWAAKPIRIIIIESLARAQTLPLTT